MTPHPTLCHFTRGISLTSQWTGNERKNMGKGTLAQATDPAVQRAVAAIIDFIYYAHFETHCDESLSRLDAAWAAFHKEKSIFLELEIHKHFDSTNFTNSNIMLILSVLAAGYRATNKVHYTRQMTVWLARQEAVYKFGTYLQWAIPGYIADSANDADNNDLEEEEGSAVPARHPLPDDPDSDDEGELAQMRATVREILSNMIVFGATKINKTAEYFVSYSGFAGDEDPAFREDIFDALSLLQCSMIASPVYLLSPHETPGFNTLSADPTMYGVGVNTKANQAFHAVTT
ncbi:hypothetical protein B0H14DRAFT_3871564 [Mycena olivaceomarginata]|nr:hypothetical protein B0H14DRAFT_3871564 [Mycena olivaceomarginata]